LNPVLLIFDAAAVSTHAAFRVVETGTKMKELMKGLKEMFNVFR
jgi:hypothetical protein